MVVPRCPKCDIGYVEAEVDSKCGGVILRKVKALKCPKCEEELFTPEQYRVIRERTKVIEIRKNVSLKEARKEILAYLKEHKEAETFDIANDLRLDLDITVKVLKKLWEEGKIN